MINFKDVKFVVFESILSMKIIEADRIHEGVR